MRARDPAFVQVAGVSLLQLRPAGEGHRDGRGVRVGRDPRQPTGNPTADDAPAAGLEARSAGAAEGGDIPWRRLGQVLGEDIPVCEAGAVVEAVSSGDAYRLIAGSFSEMPLAESDPLANLP